MNFCIDLPRADLWSYLASSEKSIVMYGMGNGADKILAVCERYGIAVSDFFASDGFVRGHSFHGKRVLSYSEAKEKYGADGMIVLLSFGSSLPSVLELICKVADECELYAPDVPVCGDTLFTLPFFEENRHKIEAAYELLSDDTSREIYKSVILYKLTGKISYLFAAETEKAESYRLLGAADFESAVDLGAYNGDTVRELLQISPNIKRIYALEPDARTYKKLSAFCEGFNGSTELIPVNAAAWSAREQLSFGAEGNRNSGLFAPQATAKTADVAAVSVDLLLGEGERIDYIKYDVEGAEKQALEGSRCTVSKYAPALLISAYHRSEDIFELPLLIHELCPSYKLYYRRYPYIPAWDLNLLCKK